jgi:hypothetical protein
VQQIVSKWTAIWLVMVYSILIPNPSSSKSFNILISIRYFCARCRPGRKNPGVGNKIPLLGKILFLLKNMMIVGARTIMSGWDTW